MSSNYENKNMSFLVLFEMKDDLIKSGEKMIDEKMIDKKMKSALEFLNKLMKEDDFEDEK